MGALVQAVRVATQGGMSEKHIERLGQLVSEEFLEALRPALFGYLMG